MAAGVYSRALACAHCKKEAGEGVKLSQCSRCCGPWYCCRSCQEAAWKGGHKSECFSMAKELFSSIESEKGSIQGFGEFLGVLLEVAMAEEGRDLSPEERQLVKTLLLVSRTLAAKIPSRDFLNPYLTCAITMGSLAGRKQGTGGGEPAGSDAWREATFKELRGALDKYRDVIIKDFPYMLIMINLVSAKVLRRLGRFQEAVALAQQELPAIEAMPWEGASALLLIYYYRKLGKWISHGDGAGRNLLDSNSGFDDKASIQQSMEAEVMFKRAIELADKRPAGFKRAMEFADKQVDVNVAEMWEEHHCLSYLLGSRRAFSEAYRFSRRAFETAAVKDLAQAASYHATVAQALARHSEAEEVLRYALSKLDQTDGTKDEEVAELRISLGHLLCEKGLLEEALMHVRYAGTIYKAQDTDLGSEYNQFHLKRMFRVSASILERMGRLEKAMECDDAMARRFESDARCLAAHSRRLKKASRDKDFQEARILARSQLGFIKPLRNGEVTNAVPEEEENAALEVIAEVLEQHGIEPDDGPLAAAIRADVAESRAIRQALQDALLVETREEALAARRRRDAENDWLGVSLGSRAGTKGKQQGKKGNHRPKKTDKGKGKHKNRARPPTAIQTGPSDTARAAEQQEEEGGAKAGGAEGSEHGPAEPAAEEGAVEEEEGPEECAVCLLDFDEDKEEAGVLLVCGHRFHGPCVDLWVGNCSSKGLQATCPMCRTEIKY